MGWFIPALIAGGTALAGALSNRGSKTQQSGTQNTNQTQNIDATDYNQGFNNTSYSGSSTPTYDPMQMAIRDYLLNQFGNKIKESENLQGYLGQGLRSINEGAGIKEQAVNNVLSSRGLSFSPIAANALAGIQTQRIGDSVNFSNQIPLLQRQLKLEDMNNLAKFFSSLPTGTTTAGTSFGDTGSVNRRVGVTNTQGNTTSTGTMNNPGNVAGGAVAGGISGLLAGWNAFGRR